MEWTLVEEYPEEPWAVVAPDGCLINDHVLHASETITVLRPGAPGGIELSCPASSDAATEGVRGPVRFMACTPRPRAHVTLLETSVVRSTLLRRTWTLAQFARARKPMPRAVAVDARVRYDSELHAHVFQRYHCFREADFLRVAPINHCYVHCELEWLPPEWLRVEA